MYKYPRNILNWDWGNALQIISLLVASVNERCQISSPLSQFSYLCSPPVIMAAHKSSIIFVRVRGLMG